MIRLRLFGIPLEIGFSFFLVVFLLGFRPGLFSPGQRGEALIEMGIWTVIVLFSVIAHELGHALTARRLGAEVSMRLYALGGLTSWSGDRRLFTPGRRVLIAAAGSLVGLVMGGLVYGLLLLGVWSPTGSFARYATQIFIYVNVIWGLINWLPVRPLDGGHMLAGTLEAISPKRGPVVADGIFLVTAVAGTVLAYRFGLLFAALLGVWLSVSEIQRLALRDRPSRRSAPPAEAPGDSFLFDPPPPRRRSSPPQEETGRSSTEGD